MVIEKHRHTSRVVGALLCSFVCLEQCALTFRTSFGHEPVRLVVKFDLLLLSFCVTDSMDHFDVMILLYVHARHACMLQRIRQQICLFSSQTYMK